MVLGKPREQVFESQDASPFTGGVLQVIMAVPLVLGDGRAHSDVAAQLACAGLSEVSREDVAVTINGQSRDRVAHTDKIVGRNGCATGSLAPTTASSRPQAGSSAWPRRPRLRTLS